MAAAVSLLATVQFAGRAEVPFETDSAMVASVVGKVEAGLPTGDYLVRWFDPVGLGAVPFGLLLELARNGYGVGVDPQYAAAALPQRVLPEDRADGIVYVVLGPRAGEVRALPGWQEIAFADPRSDADVARSQELVEFLRARLVEVGRPELVDDLDSQYGRAGLLFVQPALPVDVADAVSELVALRLPVTVFLGPPGTPGLP
ncbi:MAG: hypothetical protein R2705_00045 [Ilumatobacteraceae bacterium]